MGYREAIEDGVKAFKVGTYTYYIVQCDECGTDIKRQAYIRGNKNYCDFCKEKGKTEYKDINTEKKFKKFDIAIHRIKKQGNIINLYSDSIDKIKQLIPIKNWFQSTEEIMVALELYKDKIPFNHQVKVMKYYVDFVLPKDKIILEVDGSAFHNKLTIGKEKVRDKLILSKFGEEWEIIRIKDVFINQNVRMLSKALKRVSKERKRSRQNHNGKIPVGYNDHCM